MRLFIALDLPNELKPWVTEQQESLKRSLKQTGLRWTPPEQWHVTLRFLGDYPEHKTAALLSAMKRAAEGVPPFEISFGKLGTFSGPRMGVVWLGIEYGLEPLITLAGSLNHHLEAEGFPVEKRPFRAHITLGRSREKIPSAVLRNFPTSPSSPAARIDRLHLYQSTLGPGGSRYTRLHTVYLVFSTLPK